MPPEQEYVNHQRLVWWCQQWGLPNPYRNQLPDLEEENQMLNDFKVGCDPEFVLLNGQGKRVDADEVFPNYADPIGCDHNGRLVEFHPEPTKGVLLIVQKIRQLIQDPRLAGYKLRAGAVCNGDTLGGHVHFGFNSFINRCNGLGTREGCVLNDRGKEVTKALDTVTKALEHLDILPKNECLARRGHAHGYGRYGDVRDCNGHMEYRTMASWLYDPKVAFLCLTAAKLAAVDPEGTVEMLKNCDSFATLEKWIAQYKSKDMNAARASEKLMEKGLRHLQVDPEVDFKGRWERLGL